MWYCPIVLPQVSRKLQDAEAKLQEAEATTAATTTAARHFEEKMRSMGASEQRLRAELEEMKRRLVEQELRTAEALCVGVSYWRGS